MQRLRSRAWNSCRLCLARVAYESSEHHRPKQSRRLSIVSSNAQVRIQTKNSDNLTEAKMDPLAIRRCALRISIVSLLLFSGVAVFAQEPAKATKKEQPLIWP